MRVDNIPVGVCGIYKIIFPNGKIYIGKAKNIRGRICEHFTKADGTSCYYALRKYHKTWQEIEVEVLTELPDYNKETLSALERRAIAEYASYEKDIGYNRSPGGDGGGPGINNPSAKLTETELFDVCNMLKEGFSNVKIANKYNLHPDTIGRVNQGRSYFDKDISYPIREALKGNKDYHEQHNALSRGEVEIIVALLQKNFSNIKISNSTGVSKSTISKINQGQHPAVRHLAIDFPVRKNKNAKLTQETIEQIRYELSTTAYSHIKIAQRNGCSKDTVSDINSGIRHRLDNFEYPIRKTP